MTSIKGHVEPKRALPFVKVRLAGRPTSRPTIATIPTTMTTVIDDVRRVLSGTSPLANSADVENAHILSRANMFAKDEDIKMSPCEIIHNASAPILIEAALQREKGSYLTDTGALSVRSGAKTGARRKVPSLVL